LTGRERLVAAARGGAVDRTPVLCGPGGPCSGADGFVVEVAEVGAALQRNAETAVLARVLSPLGRAMRAGEKIVAILHENVVAGGERMRELIGDARAEMAAGLESGADGVFYELEGAYPAMTTPMEYGGHFLEADRQLLGEVQSARFNVLFVCGEHEPYIDFVSDLPAHAFAWDERSGVTAEYVRTVRSGALASVGGEIALKLNAASGVVA
jgi:hypothetical protein